VGRIPVALINFWTTYGKLLQLRGVLAQGTKTGEGSRTLRKRSFPAIVSHLQNANRRCIGGQSSPVERFRARITRCATKTKLVEGFERTQEGTGCALRTCRYVVEALVMSVAREFISERLQSELKLRKALVNAVGLVAPRKLQVLQSAKMRNAFRFGQRLA
jgi:hypothetical protein